MTDTEGHTPGPWSVETQSSGAIWIMQDDEPMYDVCDLFMKDASGKCLPFENAEANANLIAAAPETAAERDRFKDELTKTNIALNNFDEGTSLLRVEVKRLSNRIEAMLVREAELVKALQLARDHLWEGTKTLALVDAAIESALSPDSQAPIPTQRVWTHIGDVTHPIEMQIYVADGVLRLDFRGEKDPATKEFWNVPIKVTVPDSQEGEVS